MRFPSQPGLIAGLSLQVTSLERATPFWRAVLHPIGFGRTGGGIDHCLWARESAQILLWERKPPSSGTRLMLPSGKRCVEMVAWSVSSSRLDAPRLDPGPFREAGRWPPGRASLSGSRGQPPRPDRCGAGRSRSSSG